MGKDTVEPNFFNEQTFGWFLGFAACCGVFYLAAIGGASEYHPMTLASGFGAIYFLIKIVSKVKSVLLLRFPSLEPSPRNREMRINQSKVLGPAFFTIIFGPVLSWLFLVLANPSTDAGKVIALGGGLVVFFIGAYLWFNNKT